MAARKVKPDSDIQNGRPATDPELREQQLVALAVNLAEQQLRAGTASSQVITHYLKMGSVEERQKRIMMRKEEELMDAKIEVMRAGIKSEQRYQEALAAMRSYSGSYSGDDEFD